MIPKTTRLTAREESATLTGPRRIRIACYWFSAVAITPVATTCGGDHATGPVQRTTAALTIAGGDGQTGSVAQPLANPLVLKVTDAQGGALPGVVVTWAVVTGAGSVGATSTTTDAAGLASVTWTLGTVVGPNSVSAGATGLTSVSFLAVAFAGPPAQLAFSVQPSNVTAGVGISPAIQVAVQDAQGNATSSAPGITVAIKPSTGTAGAHLRGTATISAAGGVATYTTLSVDSVGTAYTLTASATGLTSATSAAFNVSAAPATRLGFTVQPTSATAGTQISPAVKVAAQDSLGNNSATTGVTLAIGTNPGGGTLLGTATVAAVAGVATFASLSIDKAGTGYTLTATATGLTSATSGAFNVIAGAASEFLAKWAGDNQTATVGTAVPIPPAVLVTDASQNPVPGVQVTFAVASGGGTVDPTTSVTTNASGVAAVTSWSLGGAPGANTLTAASSDLAGSPLSFTATGTASAGLNGSWAWEFNRNPAGSNIFFSLTALGNSVTGSGMSIGIGPSSRPDSMTITGTQSGSPAAVAFVLTLHFASGSIATYSGQLVSPNTLLGTWTEGAQSSVVKVYRE